MSVSIFVFFFSAVCLESHRRELSPEIQDGKQPCRGRGRDALLVV